MALISGEQQLLKGRGQARTAGPDREVLGRWTKRNGVWGFLVLGKRPAIGTRVTVTSTRGTTVERVAVVKHHGLDSDGQLSSFCLTRRVARAIDYRSEQWDEIHYYEDPNLNPYRGLTKPASRTRGAR